jgi:TonB family protein
MSLGEDPHLFFRALDLPRISWGRWALSVFFHTLIVALVITIPWSVDQAIQPRKQNVIQLQPPSLVRIETPHQRIVLLHKVTPLTIAVQVTPAKVRAALPPVPTSPVPQKTITFQELPSRLQEPHEMAKLELPKAEPLAIRPPVKPIVVGGFGDPAGVQPSLAPSASSMLAKVGVFDLPAGAQAGKGPSGKRVATAGFGDATIGSGLVAAGSGVGSVRDSGFGAIEAAPATARPAHSAAPAETPVQITFKPKPAYTSEAREKRIEGEVLLEILFLADGRVHVLRVMRGLGFGLDESARDAAGQIRFQPGTRAGIPIDTKGTVHIVFALS